MAFRDVENLDSKQFTLLTWCMWGTGLLLTTVRLLVRYVHQGRWFWDDAFQVAAMISLTALAIVIELQRDGIYQIKMLAASDRGNWAVDGIIMITDATREQAKLQFVSIILFWLCLWSIKGSLLMLYRRIFYKLNAYMKWWWLVAIACMTTFGACVLANFVECLPLHRRFQIGLGGSCPPMNGTVFLAITTTFDILTDVFLMVLPIRILKGLQISMRQKIGIGGIFMLSIFTIIFSICRTSEAYGSLSSLDPNFNVSLALWSMLEASVAVVVGALPSLKILVHWKQDSKHDSFNKPTPKVPRSPATDATNAPIHMGRMQAKDYTQDTTKDGRKRAVYGEGQEENQGIMLQDVKGSSQTIATDVLVNADEPKDLESGDGVSIQSFIHA